MNPTTPFDDTGHFGDFFVSTDKKLLDTFFIVKELKQTYWGSWMEPITVMHSIDHSLCFGLYHREFAESEEGPIGHVDRQVGFARVVTDYSTVAWVCDVFVTAAFRKRGLSKFLMKSVMEHPEVKPRSVLLCTKDAHALYAKFGFQPFMAMKRQGGSV